MSRLLLFLLIILQFAVSAEAQKKTKGKKMEVKITSTAFANGENIPSKYTCDGSNVSPELKWDCKAEGVKSYALICDDPDAPAKIWVHWILFNIPANVKYLNEHLLNNNMPDKTVAGINDSGITEYDGPCPPSGIHRYYFKIYALNAELKLKTGATKEQLLEEMRGHILAEGSLMGKYTRKK
jgi:Raf kinase inhibitor-like YbhB/YbcL family protein